MTRLAAVDCGTNAIRLLVAEKTATGRIREIHRAMQIVRLGEGVDASGEFTGAAIDRTRQALERYTDIMEIERVTAVRMVATSATRDAGNRDEFFDMTKELLGKIEPGAQAEVITGTEEAALSFQGAVTDLDPEDGPFCVIDLGGGSTEFVVGDASGTIQGSYSATMGCVRLTERILHHDPATEEEIEQARTVVEEQLSLVLDNVPLEKAKTWVGCAGTFTTLSGLAQGLETYDSGAIHGSILRFPALKVLTNQLLAETSRQRATHPVMHPGRADVIGGGAVVVQGIIAAAERAAHACEFIISEKDILDGMIAGLAAKV